jgi:hypothetical protein
MAFSELLRMPEPEAIDSDRAERPTAGGLRPELPSWLMSLILHLVIFLLLGLTLRIAPRPGTATERTAEVGIALKFQEGDREYYQTGADAGGQQAAATESGQSGPELADLLSEKPPVDPSGALPTGINVIGPAPLGGGGVTSASGMTEGHGPRSGSPGGPGKTTLFGIEAEAWKFVYVFDRSDSMDWFGGRPLKAAKAQLLASLDSLDSVHQFQIIFYNERPEIFNPTGRQSKLAFATEQNKRNADKFIRGITATGGTNHVDALKQALALGPDVIFFLTDADTPRLAAPQLHEIHRRAAGTVIHTIEFGMGQQDDPNNFLVKLARENDGQHVYKDISEL